MLWKSIFISVALAAVLAPAASAEEIHGTDGNDTLYGTAQGDLIWAYNGDDVAYGYGGSDTLRMGDDMDVGRGHDGPDDIKLGNNQGSQSEVDQGYGGPGGDNIYDSIGPDGTDVLCGKYHDDYLDSYDGDGLDSLYGGDGQDSFVYDVGQDDVYDPGNC